MQSTSSVAQGSFLFLPDCFSLSKLKKTRKRKREKLLKDKWEINFTKIWETVDQEIKKINKELFSKVLEELMNHLKKIHSEVPIGEGIVPCDIFLTGTNLPDHKLLLATFIHNIKKEITPYVATLWSWNCINIKSTVQNFVSQIIPINKHRIKVDDDDVEGVEERDGLHESDSCDSEIDENNSEAGLLNFKIHFQASQYNLSTLSSWYKIKCTDESKKKPLLIIIPDFESFSPNVLGEYISLLSAYSSRIPFILVLGVATTPVAVYQNLSRKVLSQLGIRLFKSEPSTSLLNNVIENVFFSERCPFRLGSKCMTFLSDIFLFHSFSVHSFIQGFKYCMMEHCYKRDHLSLCCSWESMEEQSKSLSANELENIRKLASFQKFVENSSKDERKALLLDDNHTRVTAAEMVKKVHTYTRNFHVALKILHILTCDLPKNPLGRHIREYYCKAVSSNMRESAEYKESIKLLELLSLNDLKTKLKNLITFLAQKTTASEGFSGFDGILGKLTEFEKLFCTVGMNDYEPQNTNGNSLEFLRQHFVEFVDTSIVEKLLSPPMDLPLHEIVYFDNLAAVRRRISGSPRGAIHLALNNPNCYLKCKCCVLPSSDAVMPTLPDLSVAYKIHLECNKIINMYDWLQSFAASIKGDGSDGEVDEEIQARFTRAVSELQFLGFIKPSRAKTDHVSRLTWGNS